MFKLILAELSYIKYQIHNAILLPAGLSLFAVIRGFNPTNLVCFILFLQFISYTYISSIKEKRYQNYMLLNLSSHTIALFRIVMSLIGYFIIFTLGGISYLVFNFPPDGFHDTFLELLTFGGFGLLAFYTYLILSDLFSVFQNKSGYALFNVATLVLIVVAIITTASVVRDTYNNSVTNGIIPIVLVYVGALVFGITSYNTFQRKESHLGI